MDHLQCFDYPCIHAALGSAEALVGFDAINLLDQQYFYNTAEAVSGSEWPMRVCPVHSFFAHNGSSEKSQVEVEVKVQAR